MAKRKITISEVTVAVTAILANDDVAIHHRTKKKTVAVNESKRIEQLKLGYEEIEVILYNIRQGMYGKRSCNKNLQKVVTFGECWTQYENKCCPYTWNLPLRRRMGSFHKRNQCAKLGIEGDRKFQKVAVELVMIPLIHHVYVSPLGMMKTWRSSPLP